MNLTATLATEPIAAVAARCQIEHACFHGGRPHDDRYASEIVRRAIMERDEAAWEALHQIYSPQVAAWCRRAGANEGELDDLCAIAWEKFWHAFGPERLEHADGLRAVLQYLMLCATSVVTDERRRTGAVARFAVELEPERAELLLPPPAAADTDWSEFRCLVLRCLRGERECTLIRLMFACGYKPADMPRLRPCLFPNVEAVYRTRHAIFDRLRRNVALRRWLVEQGLSVAARTRPI